MTKDKNKIAEAINILGEFCGVRDIDELTQTELKNKFGMSQVDIAVLFGGSILAGGDVFAETVNYNPIKIGSFQQIRDLLGLVYAASIP